MVAHDREELRIDPGDPHNPEGLAIRQASGMAEQQHAGWLPG
jgi:hypothetical protein